ncbi:hypothetical protein [Metasolibacillus meyeri]|uniref:hypothetical protein n=1 Tax=Metasolibacillus meyeri TaxID=1071052 RepID=UPI000D30DEF5|nr:hypothetical protein [Metasolibacillus meyeri]
MKKLLYMSAFVFMLGACGGETLEEVDFEDLTEEQQQALTEELIAESERLQQEDDAKFKEESIHLDFATASTGELPMETKVFITGEITTVLEEVNPSEFLFGKYLVTTTEGTFYIEMVVGTEMAEGNQVTLYGYYLGTDFYPGDEQFPTIGGKLVEFH